MVKNKKTTIRASFTDNVNHWLNESQTLLHRHRYCNQTHKHKQRGSGHFNPPWKGWMTATLIRNLAGLSPCNLHSSREELGLVPYLAFNERVNATKWNFILIWLFYLISLEKKKKCRQAQFFFTVRSCATVSLFSIITHVSYKVYKGIKYKSSIYVFKIAECWIVIEQMW